MTDTKPIPTPRTDAVCELLIGTPIKHPLVALSQQLERELAAIKSQPVPVEPEYPSPQYAQIIQFEGCPSVVISPETYEEITAYIDSLQSALQVAQQERDGYLDLYRDCAELASDHIELAEKAELALTAAQNSDEHNFNRWQKAEADNQRLRKDCDEHARWRADLADKLHDAEASNKRLADENEQLREMGK